MATFGRRPVKAARAGAISSSSSAGTRDRSAFQRLIEEEEERKQYAEEFGERQEREKREAEKYEKAAASEERERQKLLELRKGQKNPEVFLEIEIRGRSGRVEASGRLDIELYADVVPKTAENFRCLCTGEKADYLHFRDSAFHRIIPGFMAQGGDVTRGDGSGGMSIYGNFFLDESFARLHTRSNLLSMANCGPDTNNSQFFILFKKCTHLDKKHVVFGEIIREEGEIMKRLEKRGSDSGEVEGSVVIVDCGEILGAEGEKQAQARFRRSRSRSVSRKRKRQNFLVQGRGQGDDEPVVSTRQKASFS